MRPRYVMMEIGHRHGRPLLAVLLVWIHPTAGLCPPHITTQLRMII